MPKPIEPSQGGVALLEARGLSKHFGKVRANDGVNLVLRSGEVHVILGENGAGKSVLAKTLYGVYTPDSGEILRDGKRVVIASPAHARTLGIGLVFQDFRLIPTLSVEDNITLAVPGHGIWLHRRQIEKQIADAQDRYGLRVNPRAQVDELSMGERQQVEIIKLLLSGAKIMIFDEPTSLLAPQETTALAAVLRELRTKGLAIILITHRLADVRLMADRITVMRAGRVATSIDSPSMVSDDELVETVMGHRMAPLCPRRQGPQRGGEPALKAIGMDIADERGRLSLQGVSLQVARGEVVGVAGVSGSGQRTLAEAVLGLRKVRAGRLEVLGCDITHGKPARALEVGVAGVSEDPLETDVVPGLTVTQHMALSRLKTPKRRLSYDWEALERQVIALPEALTLQPAEGRRRLDMLSGGHIQRVMLVRALACQPGLIVAAYPTRGLDLARTRATHELLLAHAGGGAGILFISDDVDELLPLSDQIVVLHAGSLVASLDPKLTNRYDIGAFMLGRTA